MITSDHEIGVFVISSTAELPCLNFRIRDLHSVASICATELGSSQTPFFIAWVSADSTIHCCRTICRRAVRLRCTPHQ